MLTHPLTSIHPLAYTHSTLLNITILLARRPYHWKTFLPASSQFAMRAYIGAPNCSRLIHWNILVSQCCML